MARYHRQFDAKRYWANKPYCIVCKNKKVKLGQICRECESKAGFDESEMKINTKDISEKDLVANFGAVELERSEADQRLISMVGYLKDCAQALLRSVALTDLGTNDVSYFPLAPDALEKLASDNLILKNKEVLDLLYKVTARPTEFELILGTLFVKGYKGNGNRISKIDAPLLFVKLEAEKTEDDSVVFSIKEDTIHLNQSLVASLIVHRGTEETEEWAKGLVRNFARPPKGGDRDQIKAVSAGQCDIALVNTYYLGGMQNSVLEEEQAAAEKVGLFWPNQNDRGTHINISGAG